jgi:hypothetical protein
VPPPGGVEKYQKRSGQSECEDFDLKTLGLAQQRRATCEACPIPTVKRRR